MRIARTLSILRPAQWVKNGLLFGPILFAGKLGDAQARGRVAEGFAAFCLLASAGYVLNAILDRESDAAHPTKRYRPVASGAVSVRTASVVYVAALVLGGILAAHMGKMFLACAGGYVVVSLAYCVWLKHMVILDVMAIAAGFVLRMLGGAAAVPVEPSQWLVLCTMLMAVFLGFTKRRAELTQVGESSASARAVLEHYSAGFLDQMVAIVTSATVLCYVIYTAEAPRAVGETVGRGVKYYVLTVPFVLYGIFRYLYLVYHCERGESPTRTLMTDVPLLVNALLWAGVCALLIYVV